MWIFNKKPFIEILEEFNSFVYIIERLNINEDNKSPIFYIGKKNFYRKLKIKGKIIIEESDWNNYYGSSDYLEKDIIKYGKENFKRTILYLCRTQGDSGYLEAKEQINRNVLLIENNYKLYYNRNIFGRYRNQPEIYDFNSVNISNLNKINEVSGNKLSKIWINNNKKNRLVTNKEMEKNIGKNNFKQGKLLKSINKEIPISNTIIKETKVNITKIPIFKNNNYIWINKNEINNYISDGWSKSISDIIIFRVTNGIKTKSFFTKLESDNFLKINKDWSDNFNFKDKIFLIDMEIDKKVCVLKSEKNNNKYTSLTAKKIKVKSKNRIIFSGYIDLFFIKFPNIPKQLILKSLKNNGEIIKITKGKYLFINDLKFSAIFI